MKTLIVEDSERLRKALSEGLRRSGFTVDTAIDGQEGLAFLAVNDYDVIVLDLMMPRLDGLGMLKDLRRGGSSAQVLILSARDQVADRVRGLEAGADDYLVKPFAFEELVARIKTLSRRRHEVKKPEIVIEPFSVNTASRQVVCHESEVHLTPSEYNLVEFLALRRGSVLSKNQIRDQLYDCDTDIESNVIEVLVSNIRKKLKSVGPHGLIMTKRGFGYYIA